MRVNIGVKAATYPTGESLTDVMAWNHFGTETIPPRPVMRIAAEKIIPLNAARIKAYLHNLITNPNDAERMETVLLQTLGSQTAAESKRIIKGGTELQRNAPATVKKKGFDKPLFETGLMIKNISYEVEK